MLLIQISTAFSQAAFTLYLADSLGPYAKSKPETTRVNLLIRLSPFCLLKLLDNKTDLDSALLLAKEAKH
jgi:hypothetical protein